MRRTFGAVAHPNVVIASAATTKEYGLLGRVPIHRFIIRLESAGTVELRAGAPHPPLAGVAVPPSRTPTNPCDRIAHPNTMVAVPQTAALTSRRGFESH